MTPLSPLDLAPALINPPHTAFVQSGVGIERWAFSPRQPLRRGPLTWRSCDEHHMAGRRKIYLLNELTKHAQASVDIHSGAIKDFD